MKMISFEQTTHASGPNRGLPLTCAGLANPDIDRISYAGAHHHLVTVRERFGMGALRYRQFSDSMPSGPLFPHLLAVSIVGGGLTSEEANVTDYEWRPDLIRRGGMLGESVEVVERVGYADAESIIMVLQWGRWLRSRPWRYKNGAGGLRAHPAITERGRHICLS